MCLIIYFCPETFSNFNCCQIFMIQKNCTKRLTIIAIIDYLITSNIGRLRTDEVVSMQFVSFVTHLIRAFLRITPSIYITALRWFQPSTYYILGSNNNAAFELQEPVLGQVSYSVWFQHESSSQNPRRLLYLGPENLNLNDITTFHPSSSSELNQYPVNERLIELALKA